MKSVRLSAALLLLAASPFALATTYSVGAAGGCTHFSLFDALNAAGADSDGPHLIKLGIGELLTGGLDLSDPAADITIEGGYATCSASAPTTGERMVIRQANPGRALRFSNASDTRRTLTLRHLTLTGGNVGLTDILGGGGALVLQKATLVLGKELLISDNRAGNGGGVGLFGTPTRIAELVLIDGAYIDQNEAPGPGGHGNGGGIYALDNADIYIRNGSVTRNHSRRSGGGISLSTERTRLFLSPHTSVNPLAMAIIFYNTSGDETFSVNTGMGGGIYTNQGPIQISSPVIDKMPILISDNVGHMGGAIYAKGGTGAGAPFLFIKIHNAQIRHNFADGKGGAFYSLNAVDWVVDHNSPGKPCTLGETPVPCSVIRENVAFNQSTVGTPGGGVGYIGNEAGSSRGIFRFARTLFKDNQDINSGKAAVAVAYGSSEMMFERCIFVGNEAATSSGGAMLRNAPGIGMRFVYNTVLDNTVQTLFHMDGGMLRTQGSILWSPGVDVWTPLAGATMESNGCVIAHATAPGAILLDPQLDAAFAPKGGSPALDFCDDDAVTAGLDAHRVAPGYDVAGVDMMWGNNDLGAIENRDILFANGYGNRWTN